MVGKGRGVGLFGRRRERVAVAYAAAVPVVTPDLGREAAVDWRRDATRYAGDRGVRFKEALLDVVVVAVGIRLVYPPARPRRIHHVHIAVEAGGGGVVGRDELGLVRPHVLLERLLRCNGLGMAGGGGKGRVWQRKVGSIGPSLGIWRCPQWERLEAFLQSAC